MKISLMPSFSQRKNSMVVPPAGFTPVQVPLIHIDFMSLVFHTLSDNSEIGHDISDPSLTFRALPVPCV